MEINRRRSAKRSAAHGRASLAASATGRHLAAGLAVSALLLTATGAAANGFIENRGWQFRSANDTIARLSTEDLRQRKKGGFFDSFQVTNNNTTITNVHGDQVFCDLQASTIGNLGSNDMTTTAGSPTFAPSPSIGAETFGNTSDTGLSGRFPHLAGLDSSGFPAQQVNSDQRNVGSNLSSDARDNQVSISAGAVNASGTTSNPVLNSEQQFTGSNQTTSITDSQACRFIPQSGASVTTTTSGG